MSKWRYFPTEDGYQLTQLATEETEADADTILYHLKERGDLSKTEISGIFSRNLSADRINAALNLLIERRKVKSFRVVNDHGRPIMYWSAI